MGSIMLTFLSGPPVARWAASFLGVLEESEQAPYHGGSTRASHYELVFSPP